MALRDLGIEADQAVVIKDSGSGAQAAAAAKIGHIVTLSHFTRDHSFPNAVCGVSDLGEPDKPAVVLDGQDIRDAREGIGVASLDRVATARR